MKRVIAVYVIFLVVFSALAIAQEDTSVATQTAGISGAIQEDASVPVQAGASGIQEDASAAAEKDINAAAPGKCGFFCRVENWLRG